MPDNVKVLFIALFDKDVFKMVAIIAAAVGGGIVKVIFESKEKKITFWQGAASFFVAIVVCYGAYPVILLLPDWAHIGGIVVSALISNYIVLYIRTSDFLKFIINKIWGINSK